MRQGEGSRPGSADINEYRHVPQWQEVLSSSVFSVDMEPTSDALFRSSLSRLSLPAGEILLSSQSPQRHVRSRQAIAQDACNDVLLGLALKGSTHFRQSGRELFAEAGDCFLIHAGVPFDYSGGRDVESVFLRLPCRSLSHYVGVVEDWTARSLGHGSVWGGVLQAYMRALAHSTVSGDRIAAATTVSHMLHILALSIDAGGTGATSHQEAMLRRAKLAVRERCTLEKLSPARIAADMGISLRYLHRLLAAGGTSFSRELERARIDVACTLLDAAGDRRLTVGEVVGQCGFVSAAHFARKFRMAKGMSPTEYRRERGTALAN